MKILVTGAKGFIGKNLIAELKNRKYDEIYECDVDTTEQELEEYTKNCEFVFHLAGVNRPQNVEEFYRGNSGLTKRIVDLIKDKDIPLLITSSIQASKER